MIKRILIAAVLALAPSLARAQLSGCQYTSGTLQLQKVRSTAVGTQIIGCINASFDTLSGSTTSVTVADWAHVRRISGLSTGTANIWISSPTIVSVGTATIASGFVFVSSGSALFHSTETVAGKSILEARDQSGAKVFNILQSGDAGFGANSAQARIHISSPSAKAFYGTGTSIYPALVLDGNHTSYGNIVLRDTGAAGQQILFDHPTYTERKTLGYDHNYNGLVLFDVVNGVGTSGIAEVILGGPTFGSRFGIPAVTYTNYPLPQAQVHISSGVAGKSLYIDGNASTPFQVGVSTLIVTADGNVGIGDSTPDAKLDVAGTFRTDSTSILGGAVTINAGAPSAGRVIEAAVDAGNSNCYGFTENTVATMDVCKSAGSSNLTVAGTVRALVRTKAQIDAITPAAAQLGSFLICSDCTVPYDVCVATGTTLSGFRATHNSAMNAATNRGCGSGN